MITRAYILAKLARFAAEGAAHDAKADEVSRLVDSHISAAKLLDFNMKREPDPKLRAQYDDLPRATVEAILQALPGELRQDPDLMQRIQTDVQRKYSNVGGDKIAGAILSYVVDFLDKFV